MDDFNKLLIELKDGDSAKAEAMKILALREIALDLKKLDLGVTTLVKILSEKK